MKHSRQFVCQTCDNCFDSLLDEYSDPFHTCEDFVPLSAVHPHWFEVPNPSAFVLDELNAATLEELSKDHLDYFTVPSALMDHLRCKR